LAAQKTGMAEVEKGPNRISLLGNQSPLTFETFFLCFPGEQISFLRWEEWLFKMFSEEWGSIIPSPVLGDRTTKPKPSQHLLTCLSVRRHI
jgi:hypothetical protein